MNTYEEYIARSRYARYLPEEKRRERYDETVERYLKFFKDKFPRTKIPWDALRKAMLDRDVMPSMRALMTAGKALERDNVAGYNCAYIAMDDVRAFDEMMYILMCGTGVGFSVERQYIARLPVVAEEMNYVDTTIVVADSKMGWASALRQLIGLLYSGSIPRWDLGRVRPKGSPLKTFGGRASGPEPLDDLFKSLVRTFGRAKGRRLNSLEVHDICCHIASAVVCGGVRRSALISLSNLTDQRMRTAKSGEWYYTEGQRALANNSVAYTEKPDIGVFMDELKSLYASRSGERGIFSRYNLSLPERRNPDHEFGTNPCSEIILRPGQFCNLSEVVIRPGDSYDDIAYKVELATILGTLQATLTDFRYLRRIWKQNCEEERLLGVSLTGIMDHKDYGIEADYDQLGPTLEALREVSKETNAAYAAMLGIKPAAAITCVKPSGTVSQLVGCSSGIHPRYSKYYIRRVRADKTDPLCKALIDAGVPYEEDITNSAAWVFSFPMRSPREATTVDDINALSQFRHWQVYDKHWCEHKPSVSIYVREHEWLGIGAAVYHNFDEVSGISFFPFDDHVYQQAPYEKITYQQWKSLASKMPKEINLDVEEGVDTTTSSQELACHGGACEL